MARVRVDERAQRLDALPDGEVDDQPVVAEDAEARGVAVVVLEAPDESRRRVGACVNRLELRDETGELLALERRERQRDVDLREVVAVDAAH